MRRTGVFATEEQIARIRAAVETPYMVVGGVPPEDPRVVCHRCALEQGLPEIPGTYGVYGDGEFVECF